VELLSEGNTKREMIRKLKEYFLAGVRLVWFIHLVERTVMVYTAPDEATILTERQTLHGGEVLPGLALPVRQIFAGITPRSKRKTGRRH
jgi:Uma2 family endonuclease